MWEQMGKVQDTISKIGKRTSSRGHTDIALQVPEQRPATADSFVTDPEAVGSYVNSLDTTAADSSAAELIRALQHSNRLQNTPAARLQIARLFEPAVRRTLADLTAGFTGVDLPYPASAAADFEQATTLLNEMAASYKVILIDVLRRRGQLARKHRLPVIYQAIKYLSECGLRFTQSYQPWPEKMWRDLNTLYLCAEREQGVDSILHQGNNPVTIRQLYCQCCAFSCCAGAHLRPHFYSQLYRSVGTHSHVVNLQDNKINTNSDTLFSVALDSAHAPSVARFSRYQPGHQVRYFDLGPLFDVLPIVEPSNSSEPMTSGSVNADRTMIGQIRKATSGRPQRQHARSVKQTLLHTESGIKEIHASLLPASRERGDATSSTLQYGTQWMIENRSKGGLGLRWTGHGHCRVNVGELIAHCEQANADSHINLHWHVGIIRWIQSNGQNNGKNELLCGVETLANYAAAATTSVLNSTHSAEPPSVVEALLLNEHPATSRPPMLLVPKDRYRIGEKLELKISYSRRLIKLVENFPLAGNFHCFGFQASSE